MKTSNKKRYNPRDDGFVKIKLSKGEQNRLFGKNRKRNWKHNHVWYVRKRTLENGEYILDVVSGQFSSIWVKLLAPFFFPIAVLIDGIKDFDLTVSETKDVYKRDLRNVWQYHCKYTKEKDEEKYRFFESKMYKYNMGWFPEREGYIKIKVDKFDQNRLFKYRQVKRTRYKDVWYVKSFETDSGDVGVNVYLERYSSIWAKLVMPFILPLALVVNGLYDAKGTWEDFTSGYAQRRTRRHLQRDVIWCKKTDKDQERYNYFLKKLNEINVEAAKVK